MTLTHNGFDYEVIKSKANNGMLCYVFLSDDLRIRILSDSTLTKTEMKAYIDEYINGM